MERQGTVVFANVSGSAELYAAVGDAAAQPAMERCLGLAAAALAAGGGRVIKRYGHGLMAVFGSPDAAAAAAAEIQGSLELAPPVGSVQLGLRIGLHHGPLVQQGKDVSGDHVNLAARLASLARKGEIITSADTAARLGPALRGMVRNVDPAALTGKAMDVALAELVWRGAPRAKVPPPAPRRLRLEHQGRTVQRRRAVDSIRIGRDPDCGLIVDHEKVSRSHCTVERRNGEFVLKDHSTNGTYVTVEGEHEVLVHQDELVLGPHGWIALGQPRAVAPDWIEFFCE